MHYIGLDVHKQFVFATKLDAAGQVVISNPLQTEAIASAKVKTDKVDSRVLAELLRAEYLPTVWVPDDYTIRLRGLTSSRTALIRQRVTFLALRICCWGVSPRFWRFSCFASLALPAYSVSSLCSFMFLLLSQVCISSPGTETSCLIYPNCNIPIVPFR